MDMPLSKPLAIKAADWLEKNFGDNIRKAVEGTEFTPDIIKGIALQETAIDWVGWIDHKTPAEILGLCVSDPSGDEPGTTRNPFPKNAADFRKKYGDSLTDMLIAEGNKYRNAKGWSPKQWLYKGYSIFQYDIQAIEEDKIFFENKLWYNIDECLDRLMKELNFKFKVKEAIWPAVAAYNGGGLQAQQYAQNVKQFVEYIA